MLLENKNFKPLKFYASVAGVPGAAVALVSVALTANAALLRTYVPKFLFFLLLLGNFIYFTFNLSFRNRIVSTSAPQVHCSLLWFSMLVLSYDFGLRSTKAGRQQSKQTLTGTFISSLLYLLSVKATSIILDQLVLNSAK